jgi:Carboxypeptidase regulatory-like domain/TonB-dependent Receptor Plug Domain
MSLKPSRVFATLLTLVALLAIGSAYVSAQTESARISGVVTDASGAVVVEAEVMLTNVEQGTTATVITNHSGVYVLPSVKPGEYRMSARKAGFKTVDVLGVVVNVQDRLEENFRLQPGSVTESITVTGGAPLIDTEDATVSTVVDRHFQENLPLNGRSFQALVQLAPGVVVTPSSALDGGQFSVNGLRAASNYWMVDGVSANIGVGTTGSAGGNGFSGALGSFSAQGGTNSLVSVDALQEFRIQTSTFAAEFGRTPGAQISIVTRSGANGFHGTAFDYVRNDSLDANDWFANHAGLPKPKERQNDFGGTFSGPIIKNNTFFFFSY